MAAIRFAKVVSSLPGTLTPDTLYLVRTGAGFDLYASDTTGSIAYPVNAPAAPAQIAYPRRPSIPRIVGDVVGADLNTIWITTSQLHFIPLVVPRNVTLSSLGVYVTTAASGTASIGIYSNTVVNGNDTPGSLLASVTGINVGLTGDRSGSINYTLQAGTLYWACLIISSNPTIRGLATTSRGVDLGRSGTTINSFFLASGSGATLPDPAPTSLTGAGGWVTPGIYMKES